MTAALATLNPAALVALASCEQRIERGLRTFIDVGQALAEIRDSRLYKGTHDTFEAYLEGRWGMSRAHAYRMISAAEVVSPMGDIEAPPTNERQTRELAKVPEDERAEVWREAVERTDGKPTAAAVREVVAERTQTPGPVEADAAPSTVPGSNAEVTHRLLPGRSIAGESPAMACGSKDAVLDTVLDERVTCPDCLAAMTPEPAEPVDVPTVAAGSGPAPESAEAPSTAPAGSGPTSPEPESPSGDLRDQVLAVLRPDEDHAWGLDDICERLPGFGEPGQARPGEVRMVLADLVEAGIAYVDTDEDGPYWWKAAPKPTEDEREEAIAACERVADSLVQQIRHMVTTIIAGLDYNPPGFLVSRTDIEACRAELDRLEERVMA